MDVHFHECMCSGNILKDFAKFNKVSEYLQYFLDAWHELEAGDATKWYSLEFHPSAQLAYRNSKGEMCYIVEDGELAFDAQLKINRLKRQRVRFNNFVSDDLVIRADGFEQECYFEWQ